MSAYYNENEPFAAEWLRNLIKAGHIAPGEVDERDIRDVRPDDLRGFTQCHFFAGIGVWSRALRLAGWSDDRPVWTGSCPCQPFSAAGRGGGAADERHLWPHWFHLISECGPTVVYGEQVASKAGLGWFDLVSADLEGSGYAVGANDICAAGVGAPHIRQRLWFVAERVADADGGDASAEREQPGGQHGQQPQDGGIGWVADAADQRRIGRRPSEASTEPGALERSERLCHAGEINTGWPRAVNGFWEDADWLFCRDGKWRPVEPGTFPLAHGATIRVGRLRAYGNAVNPWNAKEFIEVYQFARNTGFCKTTTEGEIDNVDHT